MKSKVIVINNIKLKMILFITIIFIAVFTITNTNKKDNDMDIKQSNFAVEECFNDNDEDKNEVIDNNSIKVNNNENKIDFPNEIEGTKVVGKLEIPKINLTTYILSETTKETLNKSVTKLCGKVNSIGNLCITGHNYHNDKMFGDLKKLENGDSLYITDMKGITIEYEVYDTYKVYPNETECLSQETAGEREVTLITCTTGAIKRLIVKAIEIYD